MILILSDIHANLSALEAVLKEAYRKYDITALILLGDIVNYGMRPNETICRIKKIQTPAIANIWGNHEEAVIYRKYERFSSRRGAECAMYTTERLSPDSKKYITSEMNPSGFEEFTIGSLTCLAVHGSPDDFFWKSISPSRAREGYSTFDVVFSGHSHIPHYFETCDKECERKTVFINPGSVGQPRNLNPRAQYSVFDSENMQFFFCCAEYDIALEQGLYNDDIHPYYKERLSRGT